jgi:alpha-glucosidase
MNQLFVKKGLWIFTFCLFFSCKAQFSDTYLIFSPDGKIIVNFELKKGIPHYQVNYSGIEIVKSSKLGFRFKVVPALEQNLAVVNVQQKEFDETWTQPWGEVKNIRNHYNEIKIYLQETNTLARKMNLIFRVFNDGLGFRYELPEQPNLKDFQIMDELTQFALSGEDEVWWIPINRYHRYEYLYQKSPISKIDTVHTPLTVETGDGLFLSIHEANLTDYASMTLVGSDSGTLHCDLVPWADGVKVKVSAPMQTPWRTIQIANNPGDLITSYLVLNLNEPCKLEDVSWIKPGKYVGIWWGMHLDKYTWGSGERHGATTVRTKEYIDFAAKHGFSGVLVEGWNTGWDGDWVRNGHLFSFTQPYPDYDIEVLIKYATAKGTKLIGHHETATGIDNYENQMAEAFKFLNKYQIEVVKTGYVGDRIRNGNFDEGPHEWHHGQYMARHYRKVVETAAEYEIMLDVHEPIKDTGIRRTYPNMMTREGARGMEWNAWGPGGGNPPEHTTILPFTRLLSGPMDYTPGIFELFFHEEKPENRVNTTLARQLALYVVIYSPLQMAADLPENYRSQPAFQFIVDVPVDWQETKVLHASIGDFVTIVRKDKNSEDWYLGSVTDEHARILETSLDFLDDNQSYVAEIYADAKEAHWAANPLALTIKKILVNRDTELKISLAAGGGQAIRFRPASQEEESDIPPY